MNTYQIDRRIENRAISSSKVLLLCDNINWLPNIQNNSSFYFISSYINVFISPLQAHKIIFTGFVQIMSMLFKLFPAKVYIKQRDCNSCWIQKLKRYKRDWNKVIYASNNKGHATIVINRNIGHVLQSVENTLNNNAQQ